METVHPQRGGFEARKFVRDEQEGDSARGEGDKIERNFSVSAREYLLR